MLKNQFEGLKIMEYAVVLRTSDWDCYAGWASFRMETLLEELEIKFSNRHVKPINASPEICIISRSGKEKRFCESDLDEGKGNYEDLTRLLSKIRAEQNNPK